MSSPELPSLSRRRLLKAAVGGATALLTGPVLSLPIRPRFKLVAFDGLAIFDPRPVFTAVEKLYPGQEAQLSEIWRTRQFEYTWLRTSAHKYVDFWQVTEEALTYAVKKVNVTLSASDREQLMDHFLGLPAWPDVRNGLQELKASGAKVALLSNFTPKMMESCSSTAGLEGIFDAMISTDQAKTYKPDPKAYQLALDAFHLHRDEVLFVPFAAWDAAGGKQFGYQTFWVNRQKQQAEELGVTVDGSGSSLADLVRFAT